tara:strand:+ start:1283 stop:1501 length:219 start_codon:yes stop_codon:yes gene_type:complete
MKLYFLSLLFFLNVKAFDLFPKLRKQHIEQFKKAYFSTYPNDFITKQHNISIDNSSCFDIDGLDGTVGIFYL